MPRLLPPETTSISTRENTARKPMMVNDYLHTNLHMFYSKLPLLQIRLCKGNKTQPLILPPKPHKPERLSRRKMKLIKRIFQERLIIRVLKLFRRMSHPKVDPVLVRLPLQHLKQQKNRQLHQ
jgi:hypothetical protein